MSDQRYQRLEGAQPPDPPSYDDLEDNEDLRQAQHIDIEQFEIEDGFYNNHPEQEAGSSRGFFNRASSITKKLATNFNKAVIHPVSQMIDPIYEGYKYFDSMYERSILKIGNPLVVKRLLYLMFVISLALIFTKYTTDDIGSAGHLGGGGFSSGMFYEVDKIAEAIPQMIDIKLMKENLEYFSSMPHIAGTKGDLTLAKYVQEYMVNNGIREYDFNSFSVNINYPNKREDTTYVKLKDGSFNANLKEFNKDGMEYLGYNPNALNTNNVISSNYYYANFGSKDDLQKLKDSGIKLKESIILIKYGGDIPESSKVKFASAEGVEAIIFISASYKDHDDIISKWNVGLERYSPGDVLTPGWSSGEGFLSRLPWFKSEATPKVPTIPISNRDAKEFLKRHEGKGVKFDDGFYSGESSGNAGIELSINSEQKPIHQIWNVVGSIEGREQAEKGIIIGASRDSTCYGTLSTNTGSVVLLELVKVFTALERRFNWSPSRSIYFISFDGSEYNLAGSTEWIENKKDSLQKEGYTYIDISDAVTGEDIQVNAHPLLHEVIRKVLQKVSNDGKSLLDLYKSQHDGRENFLYNLIESKNYLPFINMLNMPSMEVKFTGGDTSYPKNSCYDNFQNFEDSKIDPDMQKHKLIVEVLAKIILELVEQPIIPLNFNELSSHLQDYEKSLETYVQEAIDKDKKPNRPVMHFDKLSQAIHRFSVYASKLEEWNKTWKDFVTESNMEPTLLAMNRWKQNQNIISFNSKFVTKDLKARRPGYVNVLFGIPFNAPNNNVGKEVNSREWNIFPIVRDYLDEGDFGRAQNEIDVVAACVENAANELFEA